jgi:hypothetical protein
MIEPTTHSESAALAAYLREQVVAVRTAAHGLTEEEARLTPTRSALSVGGILKHLTLTCATWERRRRRTAVSGAGSSPTRTTPTSTAASPSPTRRASSRC